MVIRGTRPSVSSVKSVDQAAQPDTRGDRLRIAGILLLVVACAPEQDSGVRDAPLEP